MFRNKIFMVSLLLLGASVGVLVFRPEWGPLWPSLLALISVFAYRNVLLGLFLGAFMGATQIADGAIWLVPLQLVERHLLPHFGSSWKMGALLFTLLLGGFVQLLERGGIFQASFLRWLKGGGQRRVESGAAAFGLVCFFDGLANSLMVGKIFQPLVAAAGGCKLRLAYIVDTTSSAVACLAFVSTWIAFQLSMIREGFLLAEREELADPYRLFFLSWPHNYYAIFSLLLLGLVIWKQWQIGPLRRLARHQPSPSRPSVPPTAAPAAEPAAPDPDSAGIWRVGLPIGALLLTIFIGIYLDGVARLGLSPFPFAFEKLALSFAEAHVPAILILGSVVAGLLAWAFFPRQLHPQVRPLVVFQEGVVQLLQPVVILIFAWMLSSTLKDLGTAGLLGGLLQDRLPLFLLPLVIFLLGILISFTTGTSWGTMGLLMPLAIPLAFALTATEAEAMTYLPLIIGAVFSGAVFGDHCSPLSDTTIVSSLACGVDPLDHVRTQLPYAAIAGGAAAIPGFLGAGLMPEFSFYPLFACLGVGFLLYAAAVRSAKIP